MMYPCAQLPTAGGFRRRLTKSNDDVVSKLAIFIQMMKRDGTTFRCISGYY